MRACGADHSPRCRKPARLSRSLEFRFRDHVDRHLELVAAASVDDAAQRRHVAKIAADGQGDVSVADHAVVGRVQVDEAEARRMDRQPGV